MIDLPQLLYKRQLQIAEERVVMLMSICAPNMEKEKFEQFYQSISGILNQDDENEFDAEGLAKLRSRLQGGG
ncbi:hypothetical protein [Paenibacillus silvisoli]|uniref:hypothetical protein n=1 Tax=Paenibacillus silvisoli TaxID=3110539 RepID=UPI0028058C6F|nr:hypothetical protein [Paenibacillus silvisoli]